jgi:hypothetical protein
MYLAAFGGTQINVTDRWHVSASGKMYSSLESQRFEALVTNRSAQRVALSVRNGFLLMFSYDTVVV